jgi:hypothetical protein
MAKVSEKARRQFFDKIKQYKQAISDILEEEKRTSGAFGKEDLEHNLERLHLSSRNLSLVAYYSVLNSLSLSLLGVKNEAYLNEARKCLYKAIIHLEQAVSTYMDVPFSEYEDRLESIEAYDDPSRYGLLAKLGFAIDMVEEGFGQNSKWKWSFVELKGRYAVVAKNLINFKTLFSRLDPRIEGYEARIAHINLVKELLQNAADGYRQKYELSTQRADDMQTGINLLSALRRVYIMLGESEESDVAKRKIEIWRTKMETDIKKQKIAKLKQ